MRTLLALFVLASLAIQTVFSCSVCKGEGLKCHTCVSANEDECNRQGSQSCPQFADACSTITGTNTVMKSCTYKAFCDKAHHSNSGMKMDCCFTEDCNGPHKGKSASHNAGAALLYNPTLMFGALLTKLAFSRL
ncbi:uncharacterized protein LOC117397677 isoform X1 [Acipenser ruthenus]|uniref:uncharacterized protein LOC117397677 isoform X1 n=1 Tax=Acipenser ruthenus TaxID=7906 RepID=UPI00145B6149|nr:uncharacterized protein LOC117397677 isoform X1 [Acipenser ruthenus]